jgi:hypothetical protein
MMLPPGLLPRVDAKGEVGMARDYVGARSSSCRILARVSIVSRCL